MVLAFEDIKENSIIEIAKKMMLAARTAPKARGTDNVCIFLLTGEEITKLAAHMKFIAQRDQIAFFERDAINLEQSSAIIILGTPYKSLGLKNCGWCGFNTCNEKEKHANHPCVYNVHDLGIAIGSAVSIAADNRIDNRVMFSIGKAALELNYFPTDIKMAFGIPLSASGKNPFFDRKPI
ncbi:MAG: ferredoxin [Bacteroidales bacterium]|nr:ferredoxin [Bacteroidales bacterium]